jgi:glucose-6-phosphate 1-epimerase
VYSVTLAKDSLQTVINVRNEGEQSFEFQFLLHTYLRIKVCQLVISSTI